MAPSRFTGKIRDERSRDRAAVRALVTAAFGSEDEADLIDRLRADGDAALSLVAEHGGQIVGHVLFSPMLAPFGALGMAPVSVAPSHQREGIGSRLIEAGLKRAQHEGWQGVFVVGDPQYYRRFGFSADAAQGFDCVYAGPHLMALALCGGLPETTGEIAYAPAFAAVS